MFEIDIKLKSSVFSNVTGNVKPFKKHNTVLQKIMDGDSSLKIHLVNFAGSFHS